MRGSPCGGAADFEHALGSRQIAALDMGAGEEGGSAVHQVERADVAADVEGLLKVGNCLFIAHEVEIDGAEHALGAGDAFLVVELFEDLEGGLRTGESARVVATSAEAMSDLAERLRFTQAPVDFAGHSQGFFGVVQVFGEATLGDHEGEVEVG